MERRFAGLTEKQLRRGVHRSTRDLEDAIRQYLEVNNRHPKPFSWTKTADQILDSVTRFCKRTSDSRHSREAIDGAESGTAATLAMRHCQLMAERHDFRIPIPCGCGTGKRAKRRTLRSMPTELLGAAGALLPYTGPIPRERSVLKCTTLWQS